jgi:hypothetical protein
MPTVRPVDEITFDNARDFLGYLQLSAAHWGELPASTWIFRGQGNADWPLLPSAWREPWHSLLQRLALPSEGFLRHDAPRIASLSKYLLGAPRAAAIEKLSHEEYLRNVTSLLVRTSAELFGVDQFSELSDDVGLRIPAARASVFNDYMSQLRELHLNSVLSGDDSWLAPPLDDTFGLAQHHSIPTRLLDFTNRAFVAAFFAGRDPKGEAVAVWAINRVEIMASRIRVMTCRRYDNTFLHAQDGLFVYDTEAPHDFICNGQWPTVDSVLAREISYDGPILRKVVLPASQCQYLLRLLWRERISPAHLMPTYDNIAQALPLYWRLLDDLPARN